ncbi:MAG: class I SAM-dependent methyltransferase [Verrucomicrobia bacterium]|nr:class I SAM-dependent methyltransferase [Verrucomicrobiota bacterium]
MSRNEQRRKDGRPRAPHGPKPPARPQPAGTSTGWDAVAAWYDKLVGESGSDYHRHVILPAALRLLAAQPGESVIDLCCGQGVLVRPLVEAGIARYTGIDASAQLVRAARQRHAGTSIARFHVADVCEPASWADGSSDAAACLMAVHDVADIDALFSNLARSLRVGGRAVIVLMHPCFRIPKRSHWGWDADHHLQFRRIDAYATPQDIEVTTHPGKAHSPTTVFHHRPLADLIRAIAGAGLRITGCEELLSHRKPTSHGPHGRAERRAAAEFPLFLALAMTKNNG